MGHPSITVIPTAVVSCCPSLKPCRALKFLTETFLSVCQSPKTTHLKALPLSACIPCGNLKVCSIHLLKSRNLLLLQFPEVLTQFHCLVYTKCSRSKENTDCLFCYCWTLEVELKVKLYLVLLFFLNMTQRERENIKEQQSKQESWDISAVLASAILDLQHNSLYGILIVPVPLDMYMLQCHLVKPEHRYRAPNRPVLCMTTGRY